MYQRYRRLLDKFLKRYLADFFDESMKSRPVIFGDPARLTVAPTAIVNNALFNTKSGSIVVEDDVFFGHSVSLITGTHDFSVFGQDRKNSIPKEGRDIIIGRGAWICSNATILGPCEIGEHSVVAAAAVTKGDVMPFAIYAGVPARLIRKIPGEAN